MIVKNRSILLFLYLYIATLRTAEQPLSIHLLSALNTCNNLIHKYTSRYDWIYLATTNNIQLLANKVAERKNIGDMDLYYLWSSTEINGKMVRVYCTPLHAAIIAGSIEAVEYLSLNQAALSKKIETFENLTSDDIALENSSYSLFFFNTFPFNWNEYTVAQEKLDDEIEKIKNRYCVSLTSHALAKKFLEAGTTNTRNQPISVETRQKMYTILTNHR